jgi:hypothetical protein
MKPLAAEDALIKLAHFAKNRPDSSETWKAFDTMLLRLPEGLPPKKVAPALAHHSYPLVSLSPLPAHLDEAILLMLGKQRDENAAFVLAGLSVGGKERLHELLDLTSMLPWAANANGDQLRKLIKNQGWIVAGAQAAFAVTKHDYMLVTSRYLPILAADASEESLDVLLPFVRKAVKQRSSDVDWLRKEVVPLLPDTGLARAMREMLDDTVKQRETKSPALAFAKALGMDPPPQTIVFKIAFQLDRPGYRRVWLKRHPFNLEVDSTKANWFRYRSSGSGVFYGLKRPLTELPPLLTFAKSYTLRVASKGADKAKLHAWATSLLAPKKKRMTGRV